ncbi:tyrosine-type recombinase/integrase [Neisseria sp. CCUG17229]|uniref:tyrosine-type recombinase/integrase n=1 Tax=Neisseria sp. CCUG17229 TaxID=3392036 RepID=UPI003A0FE81F
MPVITNRTASSIKAKGKSIPHGGVRGLSLIPSKVKNGEGSWVFTFYCPIEGNRQRYTLGSFPLMSIKEASDEGNSARRLVEQGKNPKLEAKKKQSLAKVNAKTTLEAIAREYWSEQNKLGVWKNQSEIQKKIRRMEIYIFPRIGSRPISEINAYEIIQVLKMPLNPKKIGKRIEITLSESKGVYYDSPEAGRKIIEFLSQVFEYAEALGLRESNPMKAVRRGLGKVVDRRASEEKHYPSMKVGNVTGFIKKLVEGRDITKLTDGTKMLIIQMLLAARTGAIRSMKWEDVNLEQAVWTLRAHSDLGKITHSVRYPLPKQVMQILERIKAEKDSLGISSKGLVFQNRSTKKMYSENIITGVLRSFSYKFGSAALESDITGRLAVAHGFRTTFKAWCVQNGKPRELSEIQLTHVQFMSAVERAYDRDDRLEERRLLVQEWADYCFREVMDDQGKDYAANGRYS